MQRVSVQGVYVLGGKCPGGKCLDGKYPMDIYIYVLGVSVQGFLETKGIIQYGCVFRFLTHASRHFHIGIAPPPG